MKMSKLQLILIGAALVACSRERQPQVIGPVLGQSTARGPSDSTVPPPDAAGPIEGGPGRSLRGVGGGAPSGTATPTGLGADAGMPTPASDTGTSGTGAGLTNPRSGTSTAGGRQR